LDAKFLRYFADGMLVFLSKISAMAYNVIGEIDESFEWHAWNNNLAWTNAAVADLQMLLIKHTAFPNEVELMITWAVRACV